MLAHGRETVSAQCLIRLRTGARFTTRRIRRVTGVNAREMVSGPCPVSAQCLKVKHTLFGYVSLERCENKARNLFHHSVMGFRR